ncbi:MAG: hypothetical protein ACJAWO_002298 [Halieaceae bacterium]|jgi:hypothetical protein
MKAFSHLLMATLACLALPFHTIAQTTTDLISEDFSSNSLPLNWSNNANGSTNKTWNFNDHGNRNITAGDIDGDYAIFDSDHHGNSNHDATLITPDFNASTYNTITLSFNHQFKYYNYSVVETCEIEVYDGSNWNSVVIYRNGDQNHPNSDLITIDITTASAAAANAAVRFTYIGKYDWWWILDNVKITGTGALAIAPPTGPGGVGSNDGTSSLEGWYTPFSAKTSSSSTPSDNQSVKYWMDESGNNKTATNSGTANYQSGSSDLINGYPKITFTSINRQFKTSSKLNGRAVIAVNNPGSKNSFEGVVGFNGDKGIRRSSGANNKWQYAGGGDGANNDTWSTNSGDAYINGSASNAGTHSNSLHFVSQTRTSNYYNYLYLGGYFNNRSFTGDLTEVIIFSNALTLVEKIIIDNYLSAKFNIALVTNDFYIGDRSTNGNYDHKVAGIGKASDGTSHSDSKGTGIVQINNPSSLNNNDYLFWGENQINADYSFNTSSDYLERINSQWRVSEQNDVGLVKVSVAAADLDLTGKKTCTDLFLVVSNSSTFNTKTSYPLTLSDGVFTTATNVSFSDGDYFSFEYQDLVVIDNNGYYGGSGTSNKPSTSDACYKLLVKSSANGTYNITSDAHVREVEIEAGGQLSIESGISLTVENNIINNGIITIKESASLLQKNTGINANSGTGEYTVIRNGNTNSYIYNIWSAPISSAVLSTVFSDANKCDVWTFEKFTQAWKYDYSVGTNATCNGNSVTFGISDVILGADGVMDVTRGYFIPGNLSAARSYTGQVNNGDYTTPIATTTLLNPGGTLWGDDDWNLLGNPYPSGLDAAAFWQENAIDNNRITDALYFWDEADTTGGYNQDSDYASWTQLGAVESGNSNELPLGAVASGQGFWVVANATTNVIFTNSMRVSSNSQFFKNTPTPKNHNAWFRLESPSNFKNNILVGYNSNCTDTIDQGYDAHKLVGNSNLRFASLQKNEEFVIQSLAPFGINETKRIPLIVYSNESGTHTISEYRRENIPTGFKIYVKDKTLNIVHDLSKSAYSVSLTANITYASRFELIFNNEVLKSSSNVTTKADTPTPSDTTSTITNTTDLTMNGFTIIQSNTGFILSNENGINGTITVMDVTGKVVWHQTKIDHQTSTNISLENVTNGIYFIEVLDKNQRIFSKKILKH